MTKFKVLHGLGLFVLFVYFVVQVEWMKLCNMLYCIYSTIGYHYQYKTIFVRAPLRVHRQHSLINTLLSLG